MVVLDDVVVQSQPHESTRSTDAVAVYFTLSGHETLTVSVIVALCTEPGTTLVAWVVPPLPTGFA